MYAGCLVPYTVQRAIGQPAAQVQQRANPPPSLLAPLCICSVLVLAAFRKLLVWSLGSLQVAATFCKAPPARPPLIWFKCLSRSLVALPARLAWPGRTLYAQIFTVDLT